ncbi:uncharacterized protein LOC143016139 [Genypterus blacodes]|uniref:uncharacterized protein LOC143016139 n=1 Tax=Genypterus blacodes TaxID=154954 RepID=UPI003F7647BC
MEAAQRDMFAVSVVALLCLVPVGLSAPLTCEDLIRPLDQLDPQYLEGRWALVAGSLSHPVSLEALKLRDSITMTFYNSSEPSRTSYTQINRFGEQCQYLPYNISVEGSSFTFDVGDRFNLSGSFLFTSCPDCVVMRWDVESKRRTSLDVYLVSRRREVDLKEMEEYSAQLKCLQLPPPVVMDPSKVLCPDQVSNKAAEEVEDKTEKQKARETFC